MHLFIRLCIELNFSKWLAECKSIFLTTQVSWHLGMWLVMHWERCLLMPISANGMLAMLLVSTALNWLQNLERYWACDREDLLTSEDSKHIWSDCTNLMGWIFLCISWVETQLFWVPYFHLPTTVGRWCPDLHASWELSMAALGSEETLSYTGELLRTRWGNKSSFAIYFLNWCFFSNHPACT